MGLEKGHTSSDSKSSSEIVCNSEQSRLPLDRRPDSLNATIERNADNESDIEPIDVLVPIGLSNRRVSDMGFLGVVAPASVGL